MDTPSNVAFQFDFAVAPEGKATAALSLDEESISELDDGDLLIEGWAADFSGIDRQGENFAPGAFKRGIDTFLQNSGSLCFHHNRDQAIGRVLELEEVDGKGLYMKARVDKQEPTSPLWHVYNGVKKGSIRNLSCGGFFRRERTPQGLRITDMDFTELSVTPVSCHARTSFAVVAGKALTDGISEAAVEDGELRESDRQEISYLLEQLQTIFSTIAKRGSGSS